MSEVKGETSRGCDGQHGAIVNTMWPVGKFLRDEILKVLITRKTQNVCKCARGWMAPGLIVVTFHNVYESGVVVLYSESNLMLCQLHLNKMSGYKLLFQVKTERKKRKSVSLGSSSPPVELETGIQV